jgi:preprotein translocase subunit SecB
MLKTVRVTAHRSITKIAMAEKQRPKNQSGEAGDASSQSTTAIHTEQPDLSVLRQYIRDLSFESPSAPETLKSPGQNPKIQIEVHVTVTPGPQDLFEVMLKLQAQTKNDTTVIYHLELSYGGIFRVSNMPAQLLEPILWINCPMILFPFVRRMAADITIDGGYPPLLLDPINFASLYARKLAQAKGTEVTNPPL